MKIYHTATQEDYNALMIELDNQGYTWQSGDKMQDLEYFERYKQKTVIKAYEDREVVYSCLDEVDETDDIIEYKSKGNIMNKLELKQQSQDLLFNITSIIGAFTTDLELTDYELSKTQKLVKKFDETLAEIIESRKPKFKIDDYVVDTKRNTMTKVFKIACDGVFGDYILRLDNGNLKKIVFCCDFESLRHATKEEVIKYKLAMHYYEAGRKSLETKEGDFISLADTYADKFLSLTDKYSEEFIGLIEQYTKEAETEAKK